MLIRTDPASDAPLYDQIAASVRAETAAGRLAPGDRLPSARDVAEALDVNLHTVLRAYQALRDEGLVEMRRGRGAIITERAAAYEDLSDEVAALMARARELGLEVDAVVALLRAHDPGSPGDTST
ncbi:GntR family transcriptional regulator [Demequina capsici]|uniref:GntR family transcriptional regulator n=1 Tax=Demequina capsici TaxID=3075620 RepID=A0AA96F976_9MICO|nr:GntR family transcriptional regulator [Demequina sp. OYTSA14]WNM25015.1 GntR family transcriptional regulator [Demequina sp. OYTSA14]